MAAIVAAIVAGVMLFRLQYNESYQENIIVSQPPVENKTYTVNGVTFDMIGVQGGTFRMGATSEQGSDGFDFAKPTHKVTLSSYSIGKTEVTQALWKAVMGSYPSEYKGDNFPVEQVSWVDCQVFIQELNELTGGNFRLPTEAEWEFAARGGNRCCIYKYSGSDDINSVAWCLETTNDSGTKPVATKDHNELGIYDMSGNVWEWCSDWYDEYSSSHQINPAGPASGYICVRRGGGCDTPESCCRVSFRDYDAPIYSAPTYGFRLASGL